MIINRGIVLAIFTIILLSGCAYVVVEVRSVPSLEAWDGVFDAEEYHPSDISSTVLVDEIELDLYLSNYTTEYRGLKILGVESRRDPNANPQDDELIVLLLGIKNKRPTKAMSFFAHQMNLIIQGDGKEIYLEPKNVFLGEQKAACEFDFNGKSWGENSTNISSKPITIIPRSNLEKDVYYCFNIIFEANGLISKGSLAVDFENSGLFSGGMNPIFFHPKKVRWIRGR